MPIRRDVGGQKVRASSPHRSSSTLASVRALVAVLVVFVVQNADAIHVKFLVWEADLSQALVVFLSLLSGVVFGVAFNRWQRWRASHVRK
jgi:uncharacterized integral membrane protein